MTDYTPQAVAFLEEIEKEEGLHEWGDKESILSALTMTLQGAAEFQAKYPVVPHFASTVRTIIKEFLVKRLKVERDIKLHPEVKQIPIKAPLFIIGCPRSGTTTLQHLIHQDPLTRSPSLYEMVTPAKDDPAQSADAWHAERLAACKAFLDSIMTRFDPIYLSLHPMDPYLPEECSQIMGSDMFIQELIAVGIYPVFYQNPMRHVKTYQFHKQAMQLMEFHNPQGKQHWTFKMPLHMSMWQQLRAVYPDAQFVMMHREMDSLIPAFMGMTNIKSSWMFADQNVNKAVMAGRFKFLVSHYNTTLTGIDAAFKGAENPPTVVHCRCKDLTVDPAKEIERIYKELGREFSPEFKAKIISTFAEMNAKRGAGHAHSLEGTGFTKESLRETFADYHNMYGL